MLDYKEELNKNIDNLRKELKTAETPVKWLVANTGYLGKAYYFLANSSLHLNDINSYRLYLSKASQSYILGFEYSLGLKTVPYDINKKVDYFDAEGAFSSLSCSNHTSLWQPFFKLYKPFRMDDFKRGYRESGKNSHDQVIFFYESLYNIVMGKEEDLVKSLDGLRAAKEVFRDYRGMYEILSGIHLKDETLFLKGIDKHLAWFNRSRECREHINYPYCYMVMGLINLAKYTGFNVAIPDNKNIHQGVISDLPDDFTFEGIPEVLAAIEKSTKPSVFSKLTNLFKK